MLPAAPRGGCLAPSASERRPRDRWRRWICVASIDTTQLGVAAYLYAIGEPVFAAVLFGLVLPQMFSQISFLQDPVANDVKYQAAAQPFLVFGILTTALAVGHHTF